jgi:hypothetical protein
MNVMGNDRNAPAAKGDLEDLETRLKGEISELEARLTEKMRDMQTKLLHAFYGFAESAQARFEAQDDTESALKRRLTSLEGRLLEVDRRLKMPPAA